MFLFFSEYVYTHQWMACMDTCRAFIHVWICMVGMRYAAPVPKGLGEMPGFNDPVEEFPTSTQLHDEVNISASRGFAELCHSCGHSKQNLRQTAALWGPNILEGLVELDDVGVVHHFHDGNLLGSHAWMAWIRAKESVISCDISDILIEHSEFAHLQVPIIVRIEWTPTILERQAISLLEAFDVLHLRFGNGLYCSDSLGTLALWVSLMFLLEMSPESLGGFGGSKLWATPSWLISIFNRTITHDLSITGEEPESSTPSGLCRYVRCFGDRPVGPFSELLLILGICGIVLVSRDTQLTLQLTLQTLQVGIRSRLGFRPTGSDLLSFRYSQW